MDRSMIAAPGPRAVLDAWERGRDGSLASRVVSLLGLALPDRTPAELLTLPLGTRNRALLGLHVALVGAELECVSACSKCQELNELTLSAEALMLPTAEIPSGGFEADLGATKLRFRLPSTADVVLGLRHFSPAAMRLAIAQRCLLAGDGDLSEAAIETLARAMQEHDPGAELLFQLQCVACSERFTTTLDPAYVVWREVADVAQRLFADVDVLARAYHWPEQEILGLSAARRNMYLELAGA